MPVHSAPQRSGSLWRRLFALALLLSLLFSVIPTPYLRAASRSLAASVRLVAQRLAQQSLPQPTFSPVMLSTVPPSSAPPAVYDSAHNIGDGSFILTQRGQNRYRFNVHGRFDAQYRVTADQDPESYVGLAEYESANNLTGAVDKRGYHPGLQFDSRTSLPSLIWLQQGCDDPTPAFPMGRKLVHLARIA